MKKILVFTLLFLSLLLSGCLATPDYMQPSQAPVAAPANVNATLDPITIGLIAQQTQDAVAPIIGATQTAQSVRIAEETMSAQGTASALGVQLTRDAADLEHTAIAYSLQQTQAVDSAIAADKTRAANVSIWQTETATPATETAQAYVQRNEANAQRIKELKAIVLYYASPLQVVFWTLLPLVLIVLIAWGIVRMYNRVVPILETRARTIRQQNGQILYLAGNGDRVTMLNAPTASSFGPALTVTPDGVTVGGVVDNTLQALTNREQIMVDIARNFPQSRAGRDDLEKLLRQVQGMRDAQGEQDVRVLSESFPSLPAGPALPDYAPWDFIANYRGNGGLPVGLLEDGRYLDPPLDDISHRLFAGMTNAGKSRYGMRPSIASALSHNFVVIALNAERPSPDFRVFSDHPNFYEIQVAEPEDLIPYLRAAKHQVNQRWQTLYSENASTWSRLENGGPRVVLVIDEYEDIKDNLDGADAKSFETLVASLARLARKSGIHLFLGVQNPTKNSIKPSIKRNLLTVFFKTTDLGASLAGLGVRGAEALQDRQFLARDPSGQVVRGVAFAPNDNQIMDVIEGSSRDAEESPDWILSPDRAALEEPDDEQRSLPPPPQRNLQQAAQAAQPQQPRGPTTKELIIQKYIEGKNGPTIEMEVFGYTGGRAFYKVSATISEYMQQHPELTVSEGAIEL